MRQMQEKMEAFYTERLALRGVTVGWGRDKTGEYYSQYARDAWAAWQAASPHQCDWKPDGTGSYCKVCGYRVPF
jgi:hypothetical protein